MKPFDLLNCPLDSSHLLEASAGTGKTYSLVFLYLRLVLEKGLNAEEILVATFTNAATEELKLRIYQQLALAEGIAAELKRGRTLAEVATSHRLQPDDLHITLIAKIRQAIGDERLMSRLQLARLRFDQALITSIDGYLLQLLKDNAPAIGCYIPEDIVDNDDALIKAAYLDLAQHQFTDLGDAVADIGRVIANMNSDALFQLLSSMLRYEDYFKKHEQQLNSTLASAETLLQQVIACDHNDAIEVLRQAIEQKLLHATIYRMDKLQTFVAQLSDRRAYLNDKFLSFFSQSQLDSKLKKNAKTRVSHPLFEHFDRLLKDADAIKALHYLPDYQSLMCLVGALKTNVQQQKAEHLVMTFDDVTRIVSTHAKTLQTSIKAALIDEAQDTNTQQMNLFKQLWLNKENENTVCFFVGDPKQAIYGFRGANIYSYLNIQSTLAYHHQLATNYRSSQALNDSVNTFFAGEHPFVDERISYRAIQSDKDNQHSDFTDKALSLVYASQANVDHLAQAAAKHIHDLLNSQKHLLENNHKRLISPRDIAVLVRRHEQAKTIKKALSEYGLTASSTGKSSVYESHEAKLMHALLSAVQSGSQKLAGALMLTPLFASPTLPTATDTDNDNDEQCAATQELSATVILAQQLHRYNDSYLNHGFSVMFYQLLSQFGIASRLLLHHDGKRRLSNFIQLFELLQTVCFKRSLSLIGLCDFLANAIHNGEQETELRLEDNQAISIMTIHRAKGLEFPVVCLPFFDYDASKNRHQAMDVLVSQQQQTACLAALQTPAFTEHYQAEAEAETMRLAYVALTRAQFHNIIVLQPEGQQKYQEKGLFQRLLNSLQNRHSITDAPFSITHKINAEAPSPISAPVDTLFVLRQAKQLKRTLASAWQLHSFSRLQQQAQRHHASLQASQDDTENRQQRRPPAAPLQASQDDTDHHTVLINLPMGAKVGSALHAIYEYYMAHRSNDANFHAHIAKIIDKYCYDDERQMLPRPEQIAAAIIDTTFITLKPLAFCLNDIEIGKQRIEMKFFMHLRAKAQQRLHAFFEGSPEALEDALLMLASASEQLSGQSSGEPLEQTASEAYIHGYIDYCFQHQGKYFVLDYKSNFLGVEVRDYHRQAMHEAMQEHRYDLQALIYTAALCKYLNITDKTQYQQHIGGYIYLFIRGMHQHDKAQHGSEKNGIYIDRFDWHIIAALL